MTGEQLHLNKVMIIFKNTCIQAPFSLNAQGSPVSILVTLESACLPLPLTRSYSVTSIDTGQPCALRENSAS